AAQWRTVDRRAMTPQGSMSDSPLISNIYRLAGGNSATRLKRFSTPPVPCFRTSGTDRVTIGRVMLQDREYMAAPKIYNCRHGSQLVYDIDLSSCNSISGLIV